jgi:hypothetical protein
VTVYSEEVEVVTDDTDRSAVGCYVIDVSDDTQRSAYSMTFTVDNQPNDNRGIGFNSVSSTWAPIP